MEHSTKVLHAYNSPTWFYDLRGFFILKSTYRSGIIRQLRFFSKYMSDTHLEIAAGSGSLFFFVLLARYLRLRRFPLRVDASDYVPRMLAGAKKHLSRFPFVHLTEADVTQIRQPDNCYTSIGVANAIHCFSDIASSLRELHRVLAPNGILAANVLLYPDGTHMLDSLATNINTWGMQKGILCTPYHEEEILRLCTEAGFTILHTERHGNSLYFVATKK